MNLKTWAFCALLLFAAKPVLGQPSPPDALAESLFPPEMLVQFQSEIGLTEEQRDSIVAVLQKTQARFEQMQQQLQIEAAKLAPLLRKERIEDEAALAQFDKVLNLEREIKRTHLALIIGMKNKLSAEQQTKLQEIKKLVAAGKPPLSFQAKLESKLQKVQAGVERWQNEGRDPSSIGEIMQDFDPLMKAGKIKEAEALLDRVLKLLGVGEKGKGDQSGGK